MEDSVVSAATIAWLAFALGLVFGLIASKTNFCTLGAVSDALNIGDWNRMRMWLLAIAVAILGTTVLQLGGLLDVSKTMYAGSRLIWLSHIVGGLLFGVGMTLASGCGSKTLIRLGGGNLKSLVVFVFVGISAYMTMRGLFGAWRMGLLDSVSVTLGSGQDIPSLLAAAGPARGTALPLAAGVAAIALLALALGKREAWSTDVLAGGIGIGLVAVAGWYVSGHIGYVAEHPMTLDEAFVGTNSGRAESFSFIAPMAFSLELLMLWSDASRIVTFGIASALGVIAGSALYAVLTRSFRVEGFRDPADLGRHLLGAVLMGFGGVTAVGCTIGQGISGLSTLAVGSILTSVAIVLGCALTMKAQLWLMMREG
ncbi:YeeE/YedE family protein [Pseudothauera nasutitermitis]|uniref:YeeE/YedE family protein n=1 Tax=Pseudothauera nasutitermitis TaxID=2565930 RepID=A0A4S4ASZ6_9RHOO|nr:YeeE/YedE family protein [Pseudothauera nasutitermitis]THF62880.1 YeeE/YedE family protein [Pseudothauera nasutitermitis]